MVKRWDQFRNPWEREYAMRGPLWRGVADASPLLQHAKPGDVVLDLGCGDGKFLAGLKEAGFEGLGLDFSRHALLAVRERGAWPVLLGDVRHLPLRDASMETVAARYVLGALMEDDRSLAAAEIARVLRPGGVLLVEEFSTDDFRAGTGRRVEDRTFERNRGILTHYFEKDEVARLFPALSPRTVEPVVSRQRTDEGTKARHRWRWILRR